MEKQTNTPSRGSLRPHLLLMLEAKRSRSDWTTEWSSAVMEKWLSATEIQMKWCCRLSWCRTSHQPHARRNTPHTASYYMQVYSSSTRDYLCGNTHITGNKRSSDDAITGAGRGWAIKSANIWLTKASFVWSQRWSFLWYVLSLFNRKCIIF